MHPQRAWHCVETAAGWIHRLPRCRRPSRRPAPRCGPLAPAGAPWWCRRRRAPPSWSTRAPARRVLGCCRAARGPETGRRKVPSAAGPSPAPARAVTCWRRQIQCTSRPRGPPGAPAAVPPPPPATLLPASCCLRPGAGRARAGTQPAHVPALASALAQMGHATAEAVVRAGLTLVPYSLTGQSEAVAVGNVGVSGIPVELVGPSQRQEAIEKIKRWARRRAGAQARTRQQHSCGCGRLRGACMRAVPHAELPLPLPACARPLPCTHTQPVPRRGAGGLHAAHGGQRQRRVLLPERGCWCCGRVHVLWASPAWRMRCGAHGCMRRSEARTHCVLLPSWARAAADVRAHPAPAPAPACCEQKLPFVMGTTGGDREKLLETVKARPCSEGCWLVSWLGGRGWLQRGGGD